MDDSILKATKQWTLVQPVVSAFVAAIVRDFAARDDVLQETAVAVIESYSTYDPSRSFQSWALGVARNQVRSYLRRQRRDRLTFDEQVIANLADAFDDTPVELPHQLENLQTCVGKLDAKARKLIELRYSGDMKPAAMAAQLEMNPNAVAKALQRIRDKLRDCIKRRSFAEGSA